MCDLLSSKNENLHKEALRFMGGILNSDDPKIINKAVFNGVVDKVINILYSPSHNLVKEGLWTLSNFCASGPNYCSTFVKSSAMHRALNLAKSGNIDIQEEALWALGNAVTCGTDENARAAFLVETN
jgi:importin subunit alpha-1